MGQGLVCKNTTPAVPALHAVSEAFSLRRAFTVELWFKLAPGTWAASTEKRYYYLFNMDDFCDGGRNTAAASVLSRPAQGAPNTWYLPFYTNSGAGLKTQWPVVTIPDDTWTHAAFTWDGLVARAYLNGALVSERKQEKDTLVSAGEIWVGSYYWGGPFEGAIDSVRVLDRAVAFAEPGKGPTVQPRDLRNSAVVSTGKPAALPAFAKSGDRVPLAPLYVSHGRAVASPVTAPPTVDGRLDDAAWKAAPPCGSFMHNTGHYPAEDQTEFRVCYDAKNLYFGVTAYDKNVPVARRKTPRERRDGPVYDDDCLEIFLDAKGDRKTYYHMIVNANGAIYDAWRKPEADASWNGVSESAGIVGDKQWSAEFAVPLSALGVTDAGALRSMGLNVGREQYSRDGHLLAQWVPSLNPGGGFHAPRAFGLLLFGESAETMPACDAAKLTAEWKDGELLLRVPLQAGRPFTGKVLAEFSGRDLAAWREVSAPAAATMAVAVALPLQPDWARCFVRLSLRGAAGDDALSTDMLVAAFDLPELLRLRLVQPHYRNNIYADQPLDTIVAEVHSALPHPVEFTFGPRGGTATYTRRIESATAATTLSIPAAGLAVGAYDVTATLLARTGQAVSRQVLTLRKLGAHPNTVRLGADGIWLRRGQPFMPVGWFSLSETNANTRIAPVAASQGINAGATYMYEKGNDGPLKRLLDEAAKAGVGILVYPWSERGLAERGVLKMSDAVRAEVTERVNRLKDHPGLLGWYMADEPEINNTTVAWLKDMYDLICELDPHHPCVVLNDTLPGVAQYAATADICMPDPYIVPLKVGPPTSAMTKIAAFMDAVTATGKTAWITPEAFSYGQVDEGHAAARAPSYLEQRCLTFLAMVHGARGYLYFALPYIFPEPDLRVGMPHVVREVGFVAKALTAAGTEVPVKTSAPVRAFARRTDRGFLLVAVNPSTAPAEGVLACDALPVELTVLSERRNVATRDGVLRDRFAPYGVHVYTTLEGAEALPTTEAIQAEVAAYKQQLADANKDNLAFAGHGAVARASEYTRCIYLNDGTTSLDWQCVPKPGAPAWAEVAFKEATTVGRIVVDATPFNYPSIRCTDLTAFVRVNGAWQRVGAVDNNDQTMITFTLDPIRTDAIRLESAKAPLVLWAEIRAFAR